ncbi:MAG: DUF1015 domain-containing protein [Anaerolineae bacterium]|nr:DUF1015 domain-containing protein [Anaerolineae bacterium]
MATIKPFRGVRYNPQKIPDLSTVVSQPHDRVRHGLQDRYYGQSPYNIARIIKGKEYAGDDEQNNPYTRARDAFHSWQQEGILVREDTPALYVLRQTFTLPGGRTRTRQALIAALELAHFEEGIVLPHERTLAKSMTDRLNLLHATAANFGCIFVLYPGGGINELLDPAIAEQQPLEMHELFENEVHQQFWAITAPEVLAAVAGALAPRRNLIIADGHHRYETSLTHQAEMQSLHPSAPSNAGFNYTQVALVSMDDPGLVILPTHRLVRAHDDMRSAEVLERAREYFTVKPVADRQALEEALIVGQGPHPNPFFGYHDGASAVLTLRDPAIMAHLLPDRTPDWRMLDVAVVHELFIERVLGISKEEVSHNGHVEFLRDPQMGYDAVARGEADYLLVMNPTRIDQVRACTAAGERMPQKSTDFYPKMISGLVALPVSVEERL